MSGFLATGSALLAGIPQALKDLANIRPASFRGAPFVVEIAGGEGGRRLVTHQFPLRDRPFTEDLGRSDQRHRIRAFVIGDDYQAQRDDLLSACQDFSTPGLLVHPYLGERQCRAGIIRWSESLDRGGFAVFDLEFVEEGPQPSPLSVTNTAAGLLNQLLALLPIIKRAYAVISLAVKNPGFLLGVAEATVLKMIGGLGGLPPKTLIGLQLRIDGLATVSSADLPDLLQAVFTGAARNVAADLALPLAGQIRPPRADMSGGLMSLVTFGADLPAIYPTTPGLADLAKQQAALVRLFRDGAVAAVLQVTATVEFQSANAAALALTALLQLIDERSLDAADAGLDELYQGWQAVAAAAIQDITQRVQQLPRLASYSVSGSLPSLTLAQRLYGDGARADELTLLNDAPHPAFMPRAGQQLVP